MALQYSLNPDGFLITLISGLWDFGQSDLWSHQAYFPLCVGNGLASQEVSWLGLSRVPEASNPGDSKLEPFGQAEDGDG